MLATPLFSLGKFIVLDEPKARSLLSLEDITSGLYFTAHGRIIQNVYSVSPTQEKITTHGLQATKKFNGESVPDSSKPFS